MNATTKNQTNGKPRAQLTPQERKRISEKNKRIRIRRKRFVIFSFVSILVIFITGVIYGFFAVFKITDYNVAGNIMYSSKQIFESSGLQLNKNLIISNINRAEEKIETELPYIGNAQIKRDLPGTLKYIITDTKAVYAMQYEKDFLLLNGDGKILEQKAGKKPEKLALLKCPKPVSNKTGHIIEFEKTFKIKTVQSDMKVKYEDVETDILQVFYDLASAVKAGKINDITVIDISNPFDVSLVYQDRITLHIGTPKELESRMILAASVINKENKISNTQKGIIDLTILKKAYFQPIT